MTTHSDDHDFQQFARRFDQPVAPSPGFAGSLRTRVAGSSSSSAISATAVTTPGVVPSLNPRYDANVLVNEPWSAPRWMRTVEAAVAALVVMSLVAASVYFRQPEAIFELAFQPALAPERTEINVGGDPGRTWNLGDVEPETGGYRVDPNIPVADMQLGHIGYSSLLIDDSFIFSAGPDRPAGNLVRYDLERSETVWTSSAIATGQLASDREHIFAFQPGTVSATGSATLVAIDFESGDVVWEGPELASERNSPSSLVLSNGAVLATDYLGNVVAVDSDDGSLIWQYPDAFATPPPATEVPTGGESSHFTPEIVANDGSVFVGLPDKSILKLNRDTGADLGSIDLLDDYGAGIVYTTIQVRAHRLVVAVVHAEQESDQGGTFGYFPTNVLVFDAESLHLQTRTDLQNYGGNIVLTDDAAFIATATEPDGMTHVYRLDFAIGELGEPLPGIQTTRGMFLSVSGNVLMVTAYPSSIGFFDLDSGGLIDGFELDAPILETPFNHPVQMWNSNPIVTTALGDVYVIEDVQANP